MAKLREDQETTEKKNEELNAENKELTRQIIDKENDMKSLQARIGVLDDEVAKADRDLKAAKEANGESESLRQEHDILQKRFQRLEAEAERSESVNAELKTKYEYKSCFTARWGKHFQLNSSSSQWHGAHQKS